MADRAHGARLKRRGTAVPAPTGQLAIRQGAAFFILVVGYFVLGVAGLQLQSAQTGLTPVWPASGLAFAMVYWLGLRQLLAIPPAVWLLAWTVGIPWDVATIAAIGSVLEAGVPVWLLRRLGVDPGLRHLRDTLLFVAIGPLLGPMLSATAGSIAFGVLLGSELDALAVWLLWWLGNSVGLLLVGGLGLVLVARRTVRIEGASLAAVLAAAVVTVLVMIIGMLQIDRFASPLVLFLLIPVFVLVGYRGEQYPVMVLGGLAITVVLLAAAWLPQETLAQTELGVLYLDISLLWVVTFTGMTTASAHREMQLRQEVTWLANHDPLTRLPNRHAFMERLEELLVAPAGFHAGHVLMFLDLDRFRDLNDAEGHRAGDQVLRDVGVMLGQEVRALDTAARMGGDEFAVLLEDCRLLDACSIAENVRSQVERYEYRGEHGMHRVETSIGLAELGPQYRSPEDILQAAESACYDAKRAGRNRVWVFAHNADSEDGG